MILADARFRHWQIDRLSSDLDELSFDNLSFVVRRKMIYLFTIASVLFGPKKMDIFS